MSSINSTTAPHKYKHLSEFERGKIEALLKLKHSISFIARSINRSPSTVCREIKNRSVIQIGPQDKKRLCYFSDAAQYNYRTKRRNCGCKIKLFKAFAFVKDADDLMTKNKWSPDAAVGFLTVSGKHYDHTVHTKTIYNYINNHLLNMKPYKLWLKLRRKRSHVHHPPRVAKNRDPAHSIDFRPDSINNRSCFGHWEIDTVLGKKVKSAALLTLVERVSRKTIILKVESKSSDHVISALNKLETFLGPSYSDVFKSITSDNGTEFADANAIEASSLTTAKRTQLFYAHPYRSNERGSNENCNSIIRRFIPKGFSIDDLSDEAILKVQSWINSLPRKILDYQSANDVFNSFSATVKFPEPFLLIAS